MTTKKNYYVCLRFEGRPELHMTLRYLENFTPIQMAGVVDDIAVVFDHSRVKTGQFQAQYSLEAWYGPQHTVRVLEPLNSYEWPNWMLLLMGQLPAGSDKYRWYPHVTCKDEALDIKVIAVSLMCKKVEVARWDLT